MREIKFRAWDKGKKRMYCGDEINSIHHSGILQIVIEEEKNDWMVMPGDYILMQYTGLRDKNGKEIHEGDVLSYELKQGWEIFFEDGCYYMMCDGHSFLLEKARAQISEIIGNIHENPELIKE